MGPIAARIAGLAAFAACLPGANAVVRAFDLASLDQTDMAVLQNVLEFERTDVPRRLPESRVVVTVLRTDQVGGVCRHFVLNAHGEQQEGVGCRISNQRWTLGSSVEAARGGGRSDRPAAPVAAAPAPSPFAPPSPLRRPVSPDSPNVTEARHARDAQAPASPPLPRRPSPAAVVAGRDGSASAPDVPVPRAKPAAATVPAAPIPVHRP